MPIALSLYNLVGNSEDTGRNGERKCLCSPDVKNESKLRGLYHGQVGWFFTLKNPSCIDAGLPICVGEVWPVAGETTSGGEFFLPVDRRNRILGCDGDKMISVDGEQRRILSDGSGDRNSWASLANAVSISGAVQETAANIGVKVIVLNTGRRQVGRARLCDQAHMQIGRHRRKRFALPVLI
jgi:hypothetical protein